MSRIKPIVIKPDFIPLGWRLLTSHEEIKKGDWYWSCSSKSYIPIQKRRIGDTANTTIPFIRKIEDS